MDTYAHHSTAKCCWFSPVREKQNAMVVCSTKAIYNEAREVLMAWEKISLGIPWPFLVLQVKKR